MSEKRKLRTIEMKRLTVEEFHQADKLPLIVVLDDVRSLYNVGSVFRTCDAFRIEAVYLCGITATPPHPEIHKTALGGEDAVSWRYFPTAEEAVRSLHADGYFVYSEVKGVHQSVVDLSDDCLEIQQYGTKHSLNVSVTAGIVIWEFVNMLQHSEPSSHCPTGQEHHPDTDGTIPDGNYNTKA